MVKLAVLSKINLTDEEIDLFSSEINEILKYVAQLQKVDTKGLKPTDQVSGLSNVCRDDHLIDYGYQASDLLKNVPRKEGRYLKVPRMI